MLTATPARAQQLAPLSMFLMMNVGAMFMPACYQAPPQASGSDLTSSPAAGGSTQATPTNTTIVPANGNDANQTANLAVGGMTLTPLSNPFICLGANSVSAGAPLTLSTCNQSSRQMWLMRNGRLMLSQNLCLSFAASGTAALKTTPVLATCNPNDLTQVVARGSTASLIMTSYGSNFALGAQTPTSSNSNVTFENFDPNNVPLGQKWVLGADNAASGSLQAGTFKISPTDGNNNCLTVSGSSVTYAQCSASPAQGFRWNEQLQLEQNGSCLTASTTAAPKMSFCNDQDNNQKWLSIYDQGQLSNLGVSGCLNSNEVTLINCVNDGNLRFDIGALPKG